MSCQEKTPAASHDPLRCTEASRFITDYVEGVLPPETCSLFEKHLARCAACTVYFDQYQQTVTFTREAGALEPEPPPELVELTLAFLRSHLK